MAKSKSSGHKRRSEAVLRERLTNQPRSPREQLSHLDRKFGVGKGAEKERLKLHAKIEAGRTV